MECTKYTICNVTVTVRNMSPFSIDKRVFTLFKCVFSPSEYVSLPHLNIYSQVKFKWGKYTLIESVFSSFKYVDFPHLNVCSPLINVRFLIQSVFCPLINVSILILKYVFILYLDVSCNWGSAQ